MKIVPVRRGLFAGSLALALVPVLLSAAPPETVKAKPDADELSPAEKVRHNLDQVYLIGQDVKPEDAKDPLKVLAGATLKENLDFLESKAKLKFDIDDKAFLSQGCKNVLLTDCSKAELPDMRNVKVKDCLRYLLKRIVISPGEATYLVVGDKVVITTENHAPYRWIEQHVNLDCDREELSSVLKKLARATGTNLVVDVRAKEQGKTLVTVQLQDVTLETAVVLLAETSDLKPVRVGNVLFLMTKEHAKAMCNPELVIDPTTGLPIAPGPGSSLIGPCPLPDEWGGPAAGPLLQIG